MKSRPSVGVGLMLMSLGSGYMDILSYRFLGEVFPSAMTGNVALMGLSLGQGDLLRAVRNMCAFGSFSSGLLLGAYILRRAPGRRQFLTTLGVQAVVLLAFGLAWGRYGTNDWRYLLIGLAAAAMGMQSAVAHRIGLTGVTTTYFTGTMTNIAFQLVTSHPPGAPMVRRAGWPLVAFVSYLAGAILGGWSLSGRTFSEIHIGLPMLPFVLTVTLAIIIASVREDRPNSA